MKSKRFTEEQIIAVLKESEAGGKTKELCRRYGISEATFGASSSISGLVVRWAIEPPTPIVVPELAGTGIVMTFRFAVEQGGPALSPVRCQHAY